ncbi:hypothetical protein IHE49_02370 [Rhodanobacter sp. 7MK24]|uniref:hypothetical protein n=1 Tax=Rhodanobacter sp. 7MK24 TaxID=2775922 RepID=UPI00177F04DB|nr:hypothetical protein [Rhodanobacter sp. 7MK24]MBD8879321.1 hypothetical protein [Rhodanobacter sp. 7MK24]
MSKVKTLFVWAGVALVAIGVRGIVVKSLTDGWRLGSKTTYTGIAAVWAGIAYVVGGLLFIWLGIKVYG